VKDTPDRTRRHWADVALILVGLGLFGLAVWFPPFSTTGEAPQAILLWPIYALAGGLTLTALFLGQRWEWRLLARLLLVAAIGALLVGLFRVRTVGVVAWLTLVIPAAVLLVAIPFFGPMPRAVKAPVP
jgi:hypothetical protein